MSFRGPPPWWLGVFVFAVALLSSAAPARAQPAKPPASKDGPSPDARAANKRALELFKDAKYPEALDQFQRAYDLSPSWIILCNIGKTSRFTQDFARSLVAYRGCLKDGGADVDPGQRTEVEQEIAQLVTLVGWAKLGGAAGAEVTVDGAVVGTLPQEQKLPVNPGPRTFVAKSGARRREETVTMRAAETQEIDLSFESAPKKPGASEDPPRFRFPPAAVVTAWIATGVFSAAAAGTGTAALVMSSNLKGTLYVGPAQAPAQGSPIAVEAQRVRALSTAADAFIGLSVVAGAAAIGGSIVNAVVPAPKSAKVGALHVYAGPGSVSLSGSFE